MAIEVSSSTTRTLEETSTVQLFKEAMDGGKELVRIEVQLAKEELKEELAQIKNAAIGFAIALGAAVIVLNLLAMALVLALGGTPLVALAIAAAFVVAGGIAAWIGYGVLPKKPLVKTRARLEKDMNQLKEHIA